MAKLPFVVAPKLKSRIETLGSDASGRLEVERKGYLTVGEKAFMANTQGQDEVIKAIMKVSNAVAKKYKISQQEAYQEVLNGMSDPAKCDYSVTDDFPEELAEVAGVILAQEQKKTFMMAYCLLLYRVDENLEMVDVIDLHEDLVNDLVKLYQDEESKSVSRLIGEDEDGGASAENMDLLEKK